MTKLQACQRFKKEVFPLLDAQERAELTQTFKKTRAMLLRWLPRGRYVMDEDGSAIAVARSKKHGANHVFAHSDTSGGLYWSETPRSGAIYLKNLGPLVTSITDCGDEGFINFKATDEAGDALPWFSKGQHRTPAQKCPIAYTG